MSVLRLHGVGVAWAASAPIFDSASLTLDGGFYGLVGANGAGKTTLLSVLAGEREPSDGTVTLAPRNALVAYCRQVVDRRDDDVDALAARDDGLAAELRGRLALDPIELERWETLSPGERKRWQVAAALAREPDVLLLDEPTNHLDVDARKRLLDALRRFSGLGVIVSHDRAVLDALTTGTLRIHQRKVTLWPGRFSDAKLLWEQARSEQQAALDAARDRVRAAKDQLDAARRTQAAASKSISTGRRMKDKNDSDARGIHASTKASWAASKAGRVTASARTQLERAQKEVPVLERDATLGGRIFATYQRAHSPVLFHVSNAAIRRGEHVVLRDVRVTIGREDRVRLEGPNGAGKTTLLEALVASHAHPERVLYLQQELEEDAKAAALDRLRGVDSEQRGRVLSIFAALGSEPDRVLRAEAKHLSPGEARKLVLAEALSKQVWALVLDEPTNHMDLPSVERLEAALAEYPGAIVLVTHDDTFAANVTTRSLHLEHGTVT
ncbi:MAG TPA: ATP-binding cassette domain-containing protein [Thermoanaerobaculales bacterium]|jgi:ATPase subunit of ABC transporter with duplicated ATPase domains|nr:ATP-binding cassette domain-containing protein [Thermoanaerobaculales bacterium]